MTMLQVLVFVSLDTRHAIDVPADLRIAFENRANVDLEVTAATPD